MTDCNKLPSCPQSVVGDTCASPRQLEFDFAHDPRNRWELVRVGAGRDVFLEWRRKRS